MKQEPAGTQRFIKECIEKLSNTHNRNGKKRMIFTSMGIKKMLL